MKVLNFGSLNLDYVYQVEHFVQPGETLSAFTQQVNCGGKGLNQSVALAKAGAEVYHAGCFGAAGKMLVEAVHNAVVLEEVAKMARNTEAIQPNVQPAPDCIKDKHFYRKHGENAYYGQ